MIGDLFASPLALLLLPLPLVALLLLPPAAGEEGGAMRVPETIAARLAAGIGARVAGRSRLGLAGLLWIALILALAGPQRLEPSPALPVSGRDLVLVLDLSGSMDRKDFEIDGTPARRLDAVKKVAAAFVRGRTGDRIGLVIFAERAFFAAPPTFDTESVARTIEAATIGIAGRSTAIGEGLGLGLKRLAKSPAPSRVVILLSDGANNAGTVGPRDVAVLARDLGIRVHTIALGANELGMVGDDPDAVDAATLRRVAELSGGTAFRVRSTGDLEAVSATLDAMEANRGRAAAAQIFHSYWVYPAVAALLLALALAASDAGLLTRSALAQTFGRRGRRRPSARQPAGDGERGLGPAVPSEPGRPERHREAA